MKEMVGGCCVCSDERGWPENPLVYCDGQGCTVAVHQACYGIVAVPTGPWYCRKCESQERAARVRCELCPSRDGALKRTDSNGWAHVVCALYIPEVRFGNVTTMEPIILQLIPQERYNKTCYICQEVNKGGRASVGACMQCNKSGCKQQFHVTCAQALGLLCEEAGNYLDNVKYCGYCQHHYSKLKKGGNVKSIPPYKPVQVEQNSSDSSPEKESEPINTTVTLVTSPPQAPVKPVTPVIKVEPQPAKTSSRKSSSSTKSSSGTSNTSNTSSNNAVGLKNLTVNLTKEKHISKSSKGVTLSKGYEKEKSLKAQKFPTATTPTTSPANKGQKEGCAPIEPERIPNADTTKTSDKTQIKKEFKEVNSLKFTNSNFTEVVVTSEPVFGDNKEVNSSGGNKNLLKKRKADSRTPTPVPEPVYTENFSGASIPVAANVIVVSEIKDSMEEKHKKAKTDHSATPPLASESLQTLNPVQTQSKTAVITTNILHSALKTESVSPAASHIVATPTSNVHSQSVGQPNSLVVSVPLSTANVSIISQVGGASNLYQHLSRIDHPGDRLINHRLSPAVSTIMDRQSPLSAVDQRASNSPTLSALSVMHAQSSQISRSNDGTVTHSLANQNRSDVHTIGAVATGQSTMMLQPQISGGILSTEMTGGGLKISYEKQAKVDEPIKRSRSHSAEKPLRVNKRRTTTNAKQTNIVTNTANKAKTSLSQNISNNSSSSSQNPQSSSSQSSSQSSSSSLSQTSGGGGSSSNSIANTNNEGNTKQTVQNAPVNKRSSRSHPTPPPVSQGQGTSMVVPKDSPPSSPTPEEQPPKRKGRKPAASNSTPLASQPDTKDIKLFQNGVHAPHMLGNQLNPNSNMAQKMSDHLSHELEAHSVFSGGLIGSFPSVSLGAEGDSRSHGELVGPALHRNTGQSTGNLAAPTSGLGSLLGGAKNMGVVPQSLDQLLERQWEQGSQFLMEQAQHFDIASLLSCLHQLQTENVKIEEHVNSLVARRDHLLAVNARLAIPLTQPTVTVGNVNESSRSGVMRQAGSIPVENGVGGQEQYRSQQVRPSPTQYSTGGTVPMGSHGVMRGVPTLPDSARGNSRSSYQQYPVVSQPQHQHTMRRDTDTHHHMSQQKPN